MGFEDDMNDWRAERDAPAPLTEDEKAAIERAEEFARLNRNRPVFFDGKELEGEYRIEGTNKGSLVVINVCDHDKHSDPTHTITTPIDKIHFTQVDAKAAIARDTMSDPSRIEETRARQFAEENEGREVSVEGHEDKTFKVTGLHTGRRVEVKSEYTHPEGYPASLTTSVKIDQISFLDDTPNINADDAAPADNVRQLFQRDGNDDAPGF